MKALLDAVFEYLNQHWARFLTAAVALAVGWFLGRWRARAQWKKKEFLDRLNVSLNSIEDGRLLIRTVIEKSCEDVFLNDVAAARVVAAAKQTSESDPILPLPKDDYWYYLNQVLNEVSEKFAEGQLRRDAGLPVRRADYLLCLTCEVAGEMRTRKVRAMLVRKGLLTNLPAVEPKYESPTHTTRWRTLRQLAAIFEKEPVKFMAVELCFPEQPADPV